METMWRRKSTLPVPSAATTPTSKHETSTNDSASIKTVQSPIRIALLLRFWLRKNDILFHKNLFAQCSFRPNSARSLAAHMSSTSPSSKESRFINSENGCTILIVSIVRVACSPSPTDSPSWLRTPTELHIQKRGADFASGINSGNAYYTEILDSLLRKQCPRTRAPKG